MSVTKANTITSQSPPEMECSPTRRGFGTDSYTDKGLNRTFLAQQIYSNPQLKSKLESIIHPAVRTHFEEWVEQQSKSLVFAEAAILFETGSYKNYNYTILVTSPLELRISRIMNRDTLSREEVQKRIDNQWSDERKKELADFTIQNNEQNLLIPQVNNIIEKIRNVENL